MKYSLPIIIYYIFSIPTVWGQKNGVSLEYNVANNFATQIKSNGEVLHYFKISSPFFNFQIDLPISHSLRFETGYRWKAHRIYWKGVNENLGSNQIVEITHSVPVRLVLSNKLGHKKIFNRFCYTLSGGGMFDFMQQSMGLPEVSNYAVSLTTPSGLYIYSFDFRDKDINQVKSSISLDTQAKIGYNIRDYLQVYYGLGFTKGFRTLAKGSYMATDPMGIVSTGTILSEGTYWYSMLGLRYGFGDDK